MPPAIVPSDEAARLRALRSSGLLDSGADPRLDAIVIRAAALFGVPIAAVSLLDETRQHFKASTGLGVPYTSRDVAFCGHAILGTEPLIVLDATQDARFADNALVRGAPGLRFYAGIPVFGPDHQPLGALCVIDTAPHPPVCPQLLAVLRDMARATSLLFRTSPGPPAAPAPRAAVRTPRTPP